MRIAGRKNGIGQAAFAAVTLLASVTGAGSQTLAALPAVTIPAAPVGEARPVPAWTEFCARYARECAVDTSEPTEVTLTPRLWHTVTTVNRQVNTSLRAVTDQEHWGVPDRWDLAEDGSGDCEDFQLLKRKLLAQAGLPRRAMRMTVVIDEKGEGHAVLMLRTDRGDFVLDNKTSAVLPWHKTGYTYIKREADEAMRWVSLGRAVSPVVTANR
ncbi:transglutaminase-like cysteine peptidase [Methylobacterium indicum]|uniref:transglutaminase-like cysteine peptidase n=1 Tax=Methylobacterium indicum TaxID=1775910 RepID=UPI0024360FB2|nr:transglutaminase-like cysteine peptidase [Methylobacterium indicum]